jgi:hypothetical protein
MKKKKAKEFYVVSMGFDLSRPLERALQGPWPSKKSARRHSRQLGIAGVQGTRFIVRRVLCSLSSWQTARS